MADTVPPPAKRRPRRRRTNVPVTIRWGVPIAVLAVIAYTAWGTWQRRYAWVRIAGADVSDLSGELEFFAWNESGAALSPPPKLGAVEFEGAGPHAVGPELVPGAALVRVSALDRGRTFTFAENGVTRVVELGPPRGTWGVVLSQDGDPVAGARVQAFGGGPHGVLLAETVSGPEGRFELDGFSSSLAAVDLRVLASEFAVAEQKWWLEGEQERELSLLFTKPVRGVVHAPAEVDVGNERVQAFQLPGVFVATAPNGSFEMDHLPPPPTSVPLVLPDLAEGFTHRRVLVQAGDRDVQIDVVPSAAVEGYVVLASTGLPVAGSSVQHEYGPHGVEVAWCNSDGRFRIGRLPPGPVVLTASVPGRAPAVGSRLGRPRWQSGRVELYLAEGEVRRDVTILIE